MSNDRGRANATLTNVLLFLLAAAMFFGALLLPLAALAAPALSEEESRLQAARERGEIVRLHIMADGDDDESQRVKLEVRNAILQAFGGLLRDKGALSANEVCQALAQSVDDMRTVALLCARENGFKGAVTAEVGKLWLPEKRYGQVVLPEGEYKALRVTLGSGQGQNWWCVLFPQICLALSSDEESATDDAPALQWDCLRVLKNWLFPMW